MADDTVTLYSPSGDKYQTSNQTEITRLKAYGYTEKRPRPSSAAKK